MKALAALVLVTFAAGGAQAARDPWRPLHRPLRIAQLAPGGACPTTTARGTIPSLGSMPAWGTGPMSPVVPGARDRLVVQLAHEEGLGAEWAVEKVLWMPTTAYRGPLLIRGRQLDGPNEVRFEDGVPGFTPAARLRPVRELRIYGGRGHPATTRVRASGCYAWQLDGTGFTRTIVFEAVVA